MCVLVDSSETHSLLTHKKRPLPANIQDVTNSPIRQEEIYNRIEIASPMSFTHANEAIAKQIQTGD